MPLVQYTETTNVSLLEETFIEENKHYRLHFKKKKRKKDCSYQRMCYYENWEVFSPRTGRVLWGRFFSLETLEK